MASVDQRKRIATAAPIAKNMFEAAVVRNASEVAEVVVLAGAVDAEAGDGASDAANPVLVAGVSCPFNPGDAGEVAAVSVDAVVEPVGKATVLEDPVEASLDCVSKVDGAVDNVDVGPVVEVDTRELEARFDEVGLGGIN